MAKKKVKITTLKKKVWSYFSQYIRLKYANFEGRVACVTCGKTTYWEKDGMQAGHLFDGRTNSVLFNEDMVFPQCYGCNCGKNGNKEIFIPWFIDRFSRAKYDELVLIKWQPLKFTEEYLTELLEKYKCLVKELKKEKGL